MVVPYVVGILATDVGFEQTYSAESNSEEELYILKCTHSSDEFVVNCELIYLPQLI